MLLDGKVAVISGAASPRGIGLATARLFAEHGARIAIFDLDAGAAADAAAGLGVGHQGFACDVTSRESCERAARHALEAFGQVDVLINNAGITQPLKLMEIGEREWDAVLDVNLRGVLNLSQALVPHLRERRRARSPACRRSQRSAAAASSAARTTAPPRRACSASPRRWRASSAPTASASTA